MVRFNTHVPTTPYIACVNEKTVLVQPHPLRMLRTQEVDVSALEKASTLVPINKSPDLQTTVAGGARRVRDNTARRPFDVVLDRAMELHPPSSEMIPIQYHAVFNLRYYHALDEVDDSFDLGLPDLPHLARGSGQAGPLVPPNTQLEALFDKHTRERVSLPKRDVTQPSIHRGSFAFRQPALDGNHRVRMPRSSSSASESIDVRDTNEVKRSSPGRCCTQVVNKIHTRRTIGVSLRKTQNPTLKSVKASRKRERQRERDAKALEHKLYDEQTVEPAQQRSEIRACLAQRDDLKYETHNRVRADCTSSHKPANKEEPAAAAPTQFATGAESTTEQEPNRLVLRTPMGIAYLRDRATDLISRPWVNAEIEDWFNDVQDGTFEVPDEVPVPDREHPEFDAFITRRSDPFLLLYPEYAENDEHWAALSSLHEEDTSTSDESYSTAKEAIFDVAGVPESLDSSDELVSQDANQAFFDTAVPMSYTQPPQVIVIVENGRTSLQSPIPDRAQFLTLGSIRI
jgi:hypothetical protein